MKNFNWVDSIFMLFYRKLETFFFKNKKWKETYQNGSVNIAIVKMKTADRADERISV